MLYPLSYGSPEVKRRSMLARLGSRSKTPVHEKQNRPPEYIPAAFSLLEDYGSSLSRARDFGSFSVDTSSVESVVNDLSNGRNVRVNVHPIASGQVTDNTFGGDFHGRTGQLRKAARLDVINSLEPLSQRQALVKIHGFTLSPL
jgi:hypothetical protein